MKAGLAKQASAQSFPSAHATDVIAPRGRVGTGDGAHGLVQAGCCGHGRRFALALAFGLAVGGLGNVGCSGRPAGTAGAGLDAPTLARTATDAGAADATADGELAPPSPRASLIAHSDWVLLAPQVDPFEDRLQYPEPTCSGEGIGAEYLGGELVYEIDTAWCSYLTAYQTARRGVWAGEKIEVRLWHFDLTAPEPARAHVAIDLDGLAVLDEHIAIPAAGRVLRFEVLAQRDVSAGAPIHFHLHNHGENTWALIEISAGP